jgi:hypothetical protein
VGSGEDVNIFLRVTGCAGGSENGVDCGRALAYKPGYL